LRAAAPLLCNFNGYRSGYRGCYVHRPKEGTSPMATNTQDTLRWRQQRAENHRAVAKQMKTPKIRKTMLKLAEMADQQTRPDHNKVYARVAGH
jgi:hypothetical protein